jgi:hypothetical protein
VRTLLQRVFVGALGLCALTALVVSSAAAQAQTGTIAGQITEQGTGTPLAGVRVLLGASNRSATTNTEGRFTLAGVPVGTHEVRASMLGFFAAVQSVNVGAGAIVTVDFQMKATAISLDAVTVTATGEQRIREMGHQVNIVKADSLVERVPTTNVASLLMGRTANVQVLPARCISWTASGSRAAPTRSRSARADSRFHASTT